MTKVFTMFSTNPRTRRATSETFHHPPARLFWIALLMVVLAACAGSYSGPDESQSEGPVESGSWYVRVQWPHDGHPYESDRFVVYSDAASLEARIDVADRAERLWSEIVSEMGIDNEVLRLPPGQEKVDIYAFEDRFPDWAGKAYHGGLVISSPDRKGLFGLARTERGQYESTLKHELIHVMTLSLLHGGGLSEPPWVHVWFFEGFAEALSAGTTGGSIRGMDHFDYLTSKFGRLNPVSYRSEARVEGGAAAYTEYHYPMRQLAVEYLLDQDGFGRTPNDATGLFADMAAGSEFESVFENHMGIALSDYKDQFFELMNGYLPDRSVPTAFSPFGLLVISVVTISLAFLVAIRSVRSSPTFATVKSTPIDANSNRLVQIGFGLWITAVSAFGLGLYLIGVHSIGGSWELAVIKKTVGVAIMIAYLAVSAGVLTWAVRSRRNRSRVAWLIPLGVIGSAAATAALIITIL